MRKHAYVLLAALLPCIGWSASDPPPAGAEEVYYHFDFDDGVVPGELIVDTYAESGDPTETITCDASSGQLRIYDTVSSSTGLFLYPDDILTDTHISVEVTDPHGSAFLSARDDLGTVEDYSNYGCWLWRSPNTAGVALYLNKNANGTTVYSTKSSVISHPGPYVLELDVNDRETSQGVPYTFLQARLLYNDGQNSLTLHTNDFGTLGGHERIASEYALLGAILGSDQRNAGWKLDVTLDDVTIRGTLVPEPGGATLLLAGMVLSAWLRGRQRRTART